MYRELPNVLYGFHQYARRSPRSILYPPIGIGGHRAQHQAGGTRPISVEISRHYWNLCSTGTSIASRSLIWFPAVCTSLLPPDASSANLYGLPSGSTFSRWNTTCVCGNLTVFMESMLYAYCNRFRGPRKVSMPKLLAVAIRRFIT